MAEPAPDRTLLLRVFTHPACAGCGPAVKEAFRLAQDRPELRLRTVSLDSREGLAEAHAESVGTIPTLILSAGGRELRRWQGTPAAAALRAALEQSALRAGEAGS